MTFTDTQVFGFPHAVRGIRNSYNSWDNSDSYTDYDLPDEDNFVLGKSDEKLMLNLIRAGDSHSKFMRMIVVQAEITAPLYWWKEYDTYKIGTVANSCSTMHTITNREFIRPDFEWDAVDSDWNAIDTVISILNDYRKRYLTFIAAGDVFSANYYWRLIIQLLPSSYKQMRTVSLNYQVLRNIYEQRRGHKLKEWGAFLAWIETLPHSELITEGLK